MFQPEPAKYDFAKQPSKLDAWQAVQQEPSQRDSAKWTSVESFPTVQRVHDKKTRTKKLEQKLAIPAEALRV